MGKQEEGSGGARGWMGTSAPGAPQSAPIHGTYWTQSQGSPSSGLSCQSECREIGSGMKPQCGGLGLVGQLTMGAEQREGAVAQFHLCPGEFRC